MYNAISLKETARYLFGMSKILREEYFTEMVRLTTYIYSISEDKLMNEIETAWD